MSLSSDRKYFPRLFVKTFEYLNKNRLVFVYKSGLATHSFPSGLGIVRAQSVLSGSQRGD